MKDDEGKNGSIDPAVFLPRSRLCVVSLEFTLLVRVLYAPLYRTLFVTATDRNLAVRLARAKAKEQVGQEND